jgi:hypothetical protein
MMAPEANLTMHRLLLIPLLVVLSGSTSLAGGGAGTIAFSRFRDSSGPFREEIWTVQPDGSGPIQRTHAPPNTVDIDPSWAGRTAIVFTRCPEPNGRCTVWRVATDGGKEQMLSPRCSGQPPACPDDSAVAASPDGRRVVWARHLTDTAIALGDAQLQHVRLLYPFGQGKGVPDVGGFAWSPDGAQIALLVRNDNGKRFKPVGATAIFVMDSDGGNLHRITPWSLPVGGDRPSWAPGTRILFRTDTAAFGDPGPDAGQIYSIRPDGSGLRQLTHVPEYTPVDIGSWSPSGDQIVFTTTLGAVRGTASSWPDVFTMRADGSHITPVTRTRNWEGSPVWSR